MGSVERRVTPEAPVDAIVQEPDASGWLLFADPLEVIEAWASDEVASAIDRAETLARTRGAYAVGAIAYEAASAFGLEAHDPPAGLPFARFCLYDATRARRAAAPPAAGPWRMGPLEPSLDRARFSSALARIHALIAEGETYQVNFTFRLRAAFEGDPFGLFADLAAAQQGAYGALLRMGRYVVCSASPELFFERVGTRLVARPMKGTARRGRTIAEDREAAARLGRSPKDRAENVMIVDMVRNDLGRVAEVGSVDVPQLFALERYPNVWQMTSTVAARTTAPLIRILSAAFPSASVTGAPKVRTMQIIRTLESEPRGVYTGAVGLVDPEGRARFNVAIRTAVVDPGAGRVEFGVGSGIVWDSDPDREYDECLLKGAVLGRHPEPFELLETLRWTAGEGFWLLERHLARLDASAEYFGARYRPADVRDALARAVADRGGSLRVRLLVALDGGVRTEAAPLEPAAEPVRLVLAEAPIDPGDPFLYHKTTNRSAYARVGRPGGDDTVLWNPDGEATETTMANLVAEIGGRRVTPPVRCGLLAGTFRAELLARGDIAEAVIPVARVRAAAGLWVINSVRGWRRAALVDIAAGKR
jgi:para-aminobenzoate synthetase / 4-amino-4-deoxychorismate lyase